MNTFQIKCLAIIFMIIDHMGLFFFPQVNELRMLGRLSFPLFAWLIANGAYYTHDIKKYLVRLFLAAILSQVPFMLTNRLIDPHFHNLNVLFTLFLGLVAIYVIQQKKLWWTVGLLTTVICVAIAQLLQTDYGGFGVIVVVVSYLFLKNFSALLLAQIVVFLANYFLFSSFLSLQPLGLFAFFFIRFYNNKPGLHAKYLFYLFYPLQYVAYYFILLRLLN